MLTDDLRLLKKHGLRWGDIRGEMTYKDYMRLKMLGKQEKTRMTRVGDIIYGEEVF